MDNKIFCSICTPTYNRKNLLENLYKSLLTQTNNDFEWIIIDDGSKDDTEEYVQKIIQENNKFKIRYYKQKNGGKHRAVNKGIEVAKGQVFAIVDSDDVLTENAVETIKKGFSEIKKVNKKFAGVAFQRGKNKELAIGKTFKGEYIDAPSTERTRLKIEGDKFEVFYTKILKENKFPEIENEKFMTEAILWTRIANQGYIIRWYNDIIYLCEYLDGGLTDSRERLIKECPKGYALYIKEQIKYGKITLKQKLGYYSFYYKIRKESGVSIKEVAKELETTVLIIKQAAFIRNIIEKKRNKKNKKRSRTIEAIKNVIGNFAYQIVNTVTNIILPPLIISKYGSVINGLISTIKQIINYLQLVGAGISESTVVELYKPLTNGDKKKVNSIYKASEKTFNQAGIIFSTVSLIVAFIYPLFVNENLGYSSIVKIVLALSLAGVSEFFVLGKCRTLLIADQKNYIVNIAQIAGAIFSTITTIILIKLDFSIELVQVMSSLMYILRILILVIYINKNYKYLSEKAEPDFKAVSKRKDATIHQLASLIIFGSQTLFISKFCGLAEASVYSCYNLIFSGISTILSTFSSAMLAGMGSVMATDSEEKVRKIYRIYEYLYYILVFICYAITFIMIAPFIKLYVGGVTDANYQRSELVILFTILGILNCIRTPGATIINAKGHYKETKNRALIEMVICLVGQILLVGKLKIVGVLVATICSSLYRAIDVVIYSNSKILKQSVKNTISNISVNVIIFVILISIINISFVSVNNYLKWIICSTIVAIIVGIVVVIINILLHKKTLNETITYIKGMLEGRKKSTC